MLDKIMTGNKRWKFLVLFGVTMITCPYGVTMYYGNMITYVYSLRYISADDNTYDLDLVWVYSIYVISLNIGTLIGDLLQRKMGLRNAAAFGIFMFSSGITFTYFTVQHSVWAMTLTFGLTGGIGNGVILAISLIYIAGWFDSRVGIASAVASAAAGIGGNVINRIITSYINPKNLSPDSIRSKMTFFAQTQITERVASMFVVVGCVTALMQAIGFCFLKSPPKKAKEEVKSDSRADSKVIIGSRKDDSSPLQTEPKIQRNDNVTAMRSYFPFPGKENDITPKDLVHMEKFYIVSFSVFVMSFCQLVGASYYKLFGQIWIADDIFLAGIGSSSSILIIFSRLSCGFLTDKVGAKNTILFHMAVCSILLSLWYFTASVNRWWFFVWTNLIVAVTNNLYTLYPVVVVKLFGRTYCATNLFLVYLALMIAMFVSPPLLMTLLQRLGWFWLFCTGSCLSLLALLTIVIRM